MHEGIMATARLDIRLDAKLKSKVEKASALCSSTLTEYVLRVMDKDASKVIERHEAMELENDIFDRFMEACNNSATPNRALVDAKLYTEKQKIA